MNSKASEIYVNQVSTERHGDTNAWIAQHVQVQQTLLLFVTFFTIFVTIQITWPHRHYNFGCAISGVIVPMCYNSVVCFYTHLL